jgi:cytochrome P450
VLTFILAMKMYPEVQRKAQAEIDQIVGNLRLPNFSDEAALPYVQAVLKEALRWHPVTPLGGFSCVAAIISLVMTV